MHNFKKAARAAGCIVILACVLVLLDLVLYPCTYIRNDVHFISTKQVDDIYLGTSHAKINIDPAVAEEVTGRTGHNMANGNEYPIDSYYVIKLMVEKGNIPRRVIYATTPEYFLLKKQEGENYLLFYHEFPISLTKLDFFIHSVAACNIRTVLFPWYEYPLATEWKMAGSNFRKKLTGDYGIEDFKGSTQEYHESGYIERYPTDPSTYNFNSIWAFVPEEVEEENLYWIRKLVELCRENDIEFVSITTPAVNKTLENEKFKEGYALADEYFTRFYDELGVPYINFNAEPYYGMFTHKVGAFTDLDGHMHGQAAADFTRVLARILEKK